MKQCNKNKNYFYLACETTDFAKGQRELQGQVLGFAIHHGLALATCMPACLQIQTLLPHEVNLEPITDLTVKHTSAHHPKVT